MDYKNLKHFGKGIMDKLKKKKKSIAIIIMISVIAISLIYVSIKITDLGRASNIKFINITIKAVSPNQKFRCDNPR